MRFRSHSQLIDLGRAACCLGNDIARYPREVMLNGLGGTDVVKGTGVGYRECISHGLINIFPSSAVRSLSGIISSPRYEMYLLVET